MLIPEFLRFIDCHGENRRLCLSHLCKSGGNLVLVLKAVTEKVYMNSCRPNTGNNREIGRVREPHDPHVRGTAVTQHITPESLLFQLPPLPLRHPPVPGAMIWLRGCGGSDIFPCIIVGTVV